MNKLKQKLCSRTGASITFALLVFLVCAVLSSVILVAGTTSAGRMASIAEMDQRYYSVTSASALLKDVLSDKTVSVVKVTKSESTTTYTNGSTTGTSSSGDPEVKKYLVVGQNAAKILSAIGTSENYLTTGRQISDDSALLKASILNDAAYKYFNSKTTISASSPRTLTLASDAGAVDVTIEETLDSTGTITLTVYNTDGDPFKQELVFGATVMTDGDTKSVVGAPTNHSSTGGTNRYDVTTTTTRTEVTTLTWTLDSMKTL